jgi:hypothetical protein
MFFFLSLRRLRSCSPSCATRNTRCRCSIFQVSGLSHHLQCAPRVLEILDIRLITLPSSLCGCAGNEFIGDHFEQMRLSMAANSTLTSLDMRRNPGYEFGESYYVAGSSHKLLCDLAVMWTTIRVRASCHCEVSFTSLNCTDLCIRISPRPVSCFADSVTRPCLSSSRSGGGDLGAGEDRARQ